MSQEQKLSPLSSPSAAQQQEQMQQRVVQYTESSLGGGSRLNNLSPQVPSAKSQISVSTIIDVRQMIMNPSESDKTQWTAAGLQRPAVVREPQLSPLPASTLCESDVESSRGRVQKMYSRWIRGNQECVMAFLTENLWWPFLIPAMFLRSVGQIIHADNILSGLAVVSYLCYHRPIQVAAAFLAFFCSYATASFSSILTSGTSTQLQENTRLAQTCMSSVLLGLFIAREEQENIKGIVDWWGILLLYAVLCAFLQLALQNQMERIWRVQPLHLAFVAFAYVYWSVHRSYELPMMQNPELFQSNNHSSSITGKEFKEVDLLLLQQEQRWGEMEDGGENGNNDDDDNNNNITKMILENVEGWFMGILKAFGRIYFFESINECEEVAFSAIVFAAVLIFSPLSATASLLGCFSAQICAVSLVNDNNDYRVVEGIAAMQGVMTANALNFFLLCSVWTMFVSIFGSCLAAVLTIAASDPLVPPLASNLATFTFILGLHTNSKLKRIDVTFLSYPEMHRRLFRGGNSVDDEANALVD